MFNSLIKHVSMLINLLYLTSKNIDDSNARRITKYKICTAYKWIYTKVKEEL